MIGSTFPTASIAEAAIQRCPAQPDIEAVTFDAVIDGFASGKTNK